MELAAGRKRVDVRSYTTLFKHADGSTSRVRDAAENLDFRYEESVNGHLQVLVLRLTGGSETPHITIHDSHGHAAASFASAAVPEALLKDFSSPELKGSVQYYKQFFEERFHVKRRGRPASKQALALQVTVVRRRPEQACGQCSLKPFAELAAPVATVSAKEQSLYRAPLSEVGSMELSRSDTSFLLLAETAQLLELGYVAFGAAIEPGLSLVGSDTPRSGTPLAEDVTAAVVRVPGQQGSRSMRNPWQPTSLAQLVRQLALPALASQVKVFSFASVADRGIEYMVVRKRHFPDQTPAETRDLEAALRAIEGVSADGLANRVSTPSPERPAPVHIGVVGVLVELDEDGSLLVHRQGGRRVVIPLVIEPFQSAYRSGWQRRQGRQGLQRWQG